MSLVNTVAKYYSYDLFVQEMKMLHIIILRQICKKNSQVDWRINLAQYDAQLLDCPQCTESSACHSNSIVFTCVQKQTTHIGRTKTSTMTSRAGKSG